MASLTELQSKQMMNSQSSLIEVAQVGRLVGLKGELKLHLQCDFPEQFRKGKTFTTQKGQTLEVFSYSASKGLISFVGYQSRESALALVNTVLFTTKEASAQECALKEGEFFWFDIIGSKVIDEGQCLGVVDEIERIVNVDYLVVKTSEEYVKSGFPKSFYIPYIDRYIVTFNASEKEVVTKDALGLLENS